MAKAPAYIREEARKLNNALAAVARHAQSIADWVDERTALDGTEFFDENRLDMPYEFDFQALLEALDEAAESK